jgi:hypothetical protein
MVAGGVREIRWMNHTARRGRRGERDGRGAGRDRRGEFAGKHLLSSCRERFDGVIWQDCAVPVFNAANCGIEFYRRGVGKPNA